MIIKPYEERRARDPRLKAGVRAEKQMAHYLDRRFADTDRFLVLHDLRFEFEGDIAQIDHLVVHLFGVTIVESKSVSTAVRINRLGEWERQWNRSWTGMPDPLLQGERQGMLLKRLLYSREAELLDKFLLGAMQGTFTHMALDVFAAISDDGRIERAAENQAPTARKADAIPGAIEELVKKHQRAGRLIGSTLADFAKAPRSFNKNEALRIARFLHAQHRALNEPVAAAIAVTAPPVAKVEPEDVVLATVPGRVVIAECKHCGGRDLEPAEGRYGPYGKCRACGKNTAVRVTCEQCGSAIALSVGDEGFAGTCATCTEGVAIRFG